MVRRAYQEINDAYRRIRIAHASAQNAQSVMILVAAEVRNVFKFSFFWNGICFVHINHLILILFSPPPCIITSHTYFQKD